MKILLRKTLSFALIWAITSSSFSLTLKIKNPRNLRSFSDGILVADRLLPSGTEVTIPDEYIEAHFDGDLKDEKALLNWLANSFSLPLRKFNNQESEIKQDYFVPVKINGSDEQGYVTLRSLARSGSLELVTKEETPFLEQNTVDNIYPIINPFERKIDDFSKRPIMPMCRIEENYNDHPSLQNLSYKVQRILYKLNDSIGLKAADDFLNRGDIDKIIENFQSTCQPVSFETFATYLKDEAKKHSIPADLLLGVMTQESSGKCSAIHHEANGTKSLGLFQLNTSTTKKRFCKDSTESHVDINCLENPFTNLDEAIKVLKSKYKIVNDTLPQSKANFEEMNGNQKDLWRKALSAYNGGEGYVLQAYSDIQKFNNKFKTEFNPHNWEIRKAFMLRSVIEEKGGYLYGEDENPKYKYKRNSKNTLRNLSYVEAITSVSQPEGYSQSMKWKEYLEEK